MERFLLFIRDPGRDDVADLHSSKSAARKALAAYAHERQREAGLPKAISDDVAIGTYFRTEGAVYAIAQIAPTR